MSYKVIEKKSQLTKLKKTFNELIGAKLKVGFFDAQKSDKNDLTLSTVAKINEYGTLDGKIPPRPFMRQTLRKHNNFKEDIKNVLQETLTLSKSFDSLFKKLGVKGMQEIQKELTTGEFKENADYTIKKKKSSKPLMDTGQLRQNVSWRVEK